MNPPPVSTYVRTWVALLVLLAMTCGSSYISMGPFNLVTNLGIAVAKAALVLWLFMHVTRGVVMIRLIALAGVMWITVLVVLSLFDLAQRLV